jgi:hypothetical protein
MVYPNDHFLEILYFSFLYFATVFKQNSYIFSIPQFLHWYGSKGPCTPAALDPL